MEKIIIFIWLFFFPLISNAAQALRVVGDLAHLPTAALHIETDKDWYALQAYYISASDIPKYASSHTGTLYNLYFYCNFQNVWSKDKILIVYDINNGIQDVSGTCSLTEYFVPYWDGSPDSQIIIGTW